MSDRVFSSPPSSRNGLEVRLENVRVSLGGKEILRGLQTRFPAGRVTAVLGPNGAGKSTLLRALAGVVRLASGRILLGDRDASRFDRRQLGRTVALVPQDTHIGFSFRVEEIVMMGRYPHLRPLQRERPVDRKAVEEALERLDLLPLRRRDVITLSGGELQRALLARALVTEAPVILLDEPVSHLDIGHRLDILELLQEIAGTGYTVILVLHDLDLAFRHAHRVLVLDQGEKAAEGDPGPIVQQGVLEKVFGVKLERVDGEGGPFFAASRLNRPGSGGGREGEAPARAK